MCSLLVVFYKFLLTMSDKSVSVTIYLLHTLSDSFIKKRCVSKLYQKYKTASACFFFTLKSRLLIKE